MIELQKDVPVKPERRGAKPKYPFSTMEIGDSFEVDATRQSVYNSAKAWAVRHDKKAKFTTETSNGKTRIWRTK